MAHKNDTYLYFMEETDGAFDAAIAAVDKVVLTVTANTQKAVIESLTQQFNAHPHAASMIVVSDDSNSVFAHPDITGCAITVTAAA